MEMIVIGVFIAWLVFAALGAWIASQKGRSEGEGLLLGVLFGPLGAIIEALLPSISLEEQARLREAEKQGWQEVRRKEEELYRQRMIRWAEQARLTRELKNRKWESLKNRMWESTADWAKLKNRMWESTPDWAKMSAVGILVGFSLSIPLFIYWPGPYRPDPLPEAKPPQEEIKKNPAAAEPEVAKVSEEERQKLGSRVPASVPVSTSSRLQEVDPKLQNILSEAQENERKSYLASAAACYRTILDAYPNTPQAKEAAEKLKKWSSKPEEVDPQLQEILSKAHEHERKSDLHSAADCYRIILEAYPKTPEAKEAAEKLKKWGMPAGRDLANQSPGDPKPD
jgi:hypothetical protein